LENILAHKDALYGVSLFILYSKIFLEHASYIELPYGLNPIWPPSLTSLAPKLPKKYYLEGIWIDVGLLT